MGIVKYPFGPADVLTPAPDEGVIEVDIENQLTIIKLRDLDDAVQIVLNPAADIQPGAIVKIDLLQTADEADVTWGSDIVALALVGVPSDRDVIELMWDGTEFVGGEWEKVIID
jgi:hypothetical protein